MSSSCWVRPSSARTDASTPPNRRSACSTAVLVSRHALRDQLRFVRQLGELNEASLGRVHASLEAVRPLLELGAHRAQVAETPVHLIHQLTAILDLHHRAFHLVHLGAHPLHGRLHAAELLHLLLHLAGPDVGVGEPGLGLTVGLPEAGHLLVGQAHLLQPIRHQLPRALEAGEVLHGLLDARAELLDAPDARGHFADRGIDPRDIAAERAEPPGLLGDADDLAIQGGGLLAEGPHLRLHRGRALARGIEDREARLAFLHRVPEVADPLAHRMQTAIVQLEALTALPHLLAQVVERLTRRLLCLLGLLRHGLELVGAGEHLRLGSLNLRDLGLDLAEPADLLLLAAKPGVELAIQPGELGDLGRRAVHRLALLLQHAGLLRYLVRQGLEDGEAVLEIRHLGHRLIHRLEGPGDRLHPPLDLLEPAGRGLTVLVERFQARGAMPMRRQRVVGLGAHPGDLLGELGELGAQGVVLALELGDRALLAEEVVELLAELEDPLELVVHPLHPALQLVHLGLRLGHPLSLGDGRRHLGAELLDSRHLILHRHAPLPQGVQLGRPVHHRYELLELADRCFSPGHELLQRGGDVRSARINGNDAVVRAAAAFQEGDHVYSVRMARGAVTKGGTRRTGPPSATGMPERRVRANRPIGPVQVAARMEVRGRGGGRSRPMWTVCRKGAQAACERTGRARRCEY